MGKVTITKEFSFEMAHVLTGSIGKCSNIHGHSYRLSVTVTGKIIKNKNHPSRGMIINFSELKKIVSKAVVDEFDHALVIDKSSGISAELIKHNFKTITVSYQPTCENLVLEFAKKIKRALPSTIFLVRLKLRETPTSIAEWTNT